MEKKLAPAESIQPNKSARMTKCSALPLFAAVALLSIQAITLAVFGSPVVTNTTGLIVDPEEIRYEPAPPPFAVHDNWKDWETWEASPDITKAFPYYKMGYDLDGLPVYYMAFGKWDYRQWAQQSEEKVAEFWKYYEQHVRRLEKDAARSSGAGIVETVDFDGFELVHEASPKAIKLALTVFAGKRRLDRLTTYGFFVNVNFSAEMFLNSARPFLNHLMEKYEWCDTRIAKCKPLLLRKIGADQLAPKLGGSIDSKPAPFDP